MSMIGNIYSNMNFPIAYKNWKKRKFTYFSTVIMTLVVSFFFLIRCESIEIRNVWSDELFSIMYSAKNIKYLWGQDWWIEPTPPLYYTILKAWTIFGVSEPRLRSLSIMFGFLSVLFTAFTAWQVAGVRSFILTFLLLSVWPSHLEYSLEIRSYSLELAFVAASLFAIIPVLSEFERDADAPSFRSLLPSASWAVASLYAHATALFYVVGLFGALLIYPRMVGRSFTRHHLKVILITALFAALVSSPAWLHAFGVVRHHQEELDWITAPNISYVKGVALEIFLGQDFRKVFSNSLNVSEWTATRIAELGIAAIVGFMISIARRRTTPAVQFLLVLAGFGAVALIGASVVQPVLLQRTALWLILPLAISGAVILDRYVVSLSVGRRVVVTGVGVAALMVASAYALAQIHQHQQRRLFGTAIEEIIDHSAPSDIYVGIEADFHCFFDYYAPGAIPRTRRVKLSSGGSTSETVKLGCNEVPERTVEQIGETVRAGEAVWLLSHNQLSVDLSALARDKFPAAAHLTRVTVGGEDVALRIRQTGAGASHEGGEAAR